MKLALLACQYSALSSPLTTYRSLDARAIKAEPNIYHPFRDSSADISHHIRHSQRIMVLQDVMCAFPKPKKRKQKAKEAPGRECCEQEKVCHHGA